MTDRTPDPIPDPIPDQGPCPRCGRSTALFLTLEEACALFGYSRSSCPDCQLTDVVRRGTNPRAYAEPKPE
jgi:hypothetical protein